MEIEQVVVPKVEYITYKKLHVLDMLCNLKGHTNFLNYTLLDKNL